MRKIKLPSRNRVSVAPPTATFRDLSNLNKDNRKIWKWSQLASLLHTPEQTEPKTARNQEQVHRVCCSVGALCALRVVVYPGTRVPGVSGYRVGPEYPRVMNMDRNDSDSVRSGYPPPGTRFSFTRGETLLEIGGRALPGEGSCSQSQCKAAPVWPPYLSVTCTDGIRDSHRENQLIEYMFARVNSQKLKSRPCMPCHVLM